MTTTATTEHLPTANQETFDALLEETLEELAGVNAILATQ